MRSFKDTFEEVFGNGSFNDEFMISPSTAQSIHNKYLKQFIQQQNINAKVIRSAWMSCAERHKLLLDAIEQYFELPDCDITFQQFKKDFGIE